MSCRQTHEVMKIYSYNNLNKDHKENFRIYKKNTYCLTSKQNCIDIDLKYLLIINCEENQIRHMKKTHLIRFKRSIDYT